MRIHQGDIGAYGFEIAVDLDGRYTVETQIGELVHADVSPFVFHETSDVAKGIVCLGIVLTEKPGTRSEGIEQLDGKDWGVFVFLGAQWVLLHLAGNSGKETCFFHGVEGLRNRHDTFPPLASRQKSKEEPERGKSLSFLQRVVRSMPYFNPQTHEHVMPLLEAGEAIPATALLEELNHLRMQDEIETQGR